MAKRFNNKTNMKKAQFIAVRSEKSPQLRTKGFVDF